MPEIKRDILEKQLRDHVETLAAKIGERNVYQPANYRKAADYIRDFWRQLSLQVNFQIFDVGGIQCENISVDIGTAGDKDDLIVVGAHYDSVYGSPGANDNASGVAAVLEISRTLLSASTKRVVRFVAFANEEPPFFKTENMGSRRFAQEMAGRGEKVHAMLSIETIGYYTDEPNSQSYPPLFKLFYPSIGNFIGIAGNLKSRSLVKRVAQYFKRENNFPVEYISAPVFIPGIDWSDQASFWEFGYPAVMITDTAPYRYPEYHRANDLPEKLNYPAFSRVVEGLRGAILHLANEGF